MGNRNTAYFNTVNEQLLDNSESSRQFRLPGFRKVGNVFIVDVAAGLRIGYLL